jgi:hypothetical protein
MITITPNKDLLLWLAVFYFTFDGIANIILGALNYKKSEYYDSGNIILGILILILITVVILT